MSIQLILWPARLTQPVLQFTSSVVCISKFCPELQFDSRIHSCFLLAWIFEYNSACALDCFWKSMGPERNSGCVCNRSTMNFNTSTPQKCILLQNYFCMLLSVWWILLIKNFTQTKLVRLPLTSQVLHNFLSKQTNKINCKKSEKVVGGVKICF